MSSKHVIPPQLAQKLLRRFLRNELTEEVEGDLEEQFYAKLEETSVFKANINYWYQVLNYLRPFAIRKSKQIHLNYYAMFRHNLTLTYRNFLKYKSSFLINLTGLSTGLACALLIFLWVKNELAIDQFHGKKERLLQVMEKRTQDGNIFTMTSTPWLLSDALAEEMPEVEFATVATQAGWFEKFTLRVDDKITKEGGIYAGPDYFNIFSFNMIQGDPSQVLADKNAIVISKELALKFFDTIEDAIGKTIEFQQEKEFLISGVFETIPISSSIRFDFALSIKQITDEYPQVTDWKNAGPDTYLVLKEGVDVNSFNEKIAGIITEKTEDTSREILLTRFVDNYLYGNFENGVQSGGRIEYIRLFSIIAIFILLIACINFMNLSTARASRRIKEVGVKKALGVQRKALIMQYLTESVMLSFIALFIAIVIVLILLPQFNLIMGKQLVFQPDLIQVLILLSAVLLTGILAGSYPALYLSGFKPVVILKGKLQNSWSELWVRKGLVIFQFSLSVIFIVCVMVIYQQIRFVQNKNIGYNKDNVIHFEIEGKIQQSLETFLTELKRIPGVVSASSAGQSTVGGGNTSNISWEGKDPEQRVGFAKRPANYDLLELLDIQLLEGRSFSRDYEDSLAVIFNEAGIKAMGMDDPIGKTIQTGPLNCKIIGIIKDFHFESLKNKVDPMFFMLSPMYTRKVMVRIEEGKVNETLTSIEKFYRQYNPGFAFDFRFIDQDYQVQYTAEKRVGDLSKYFSIIAIIISCLGLFGLAAFTAERRLKEIGVRKVLGAGSVKIITLLTTDFIKMVLVAIFIALPISYLIA
ncbi:MAG: ABC transporter permease, partial [Bacteroidota bacterium]